MPTDPETVVSLDAYRTPGVRVFSGDERGRAVAEAMLKDHGHVEVVEIPGDVYSVSFSFWRGFFGVLPNVMVRGNLVHMRTLAEVRHAAD